MSTHLTVPLRTTTSPLLNKIQVSSSLWILILLYHSGTSQRTGTSLLIICAGSTHTTGHRPSSNSVHGLLVWPDGTNVGHTHEVKSFFIWSVQSIIRAGIVILETGNQLHNMQQFSKLTEYSYICTSIFNTSCNICHIIFDTLQIIQAFVLS